MHLREKANLNFEVTKFTKILMKRQKTAYYTKRK